MDFRIFVFVCGVGDCLGFQLLGGAGGICGERREEELGELAMIDLASQQASAASAASTASTASQHIQHSQYYYTLLITSRAVTKLAPGLWFFSGQLLCVCIANGDGRGAGVCARRGRDALFSVKNRS